jgi:hypothetical protein
VVLLLFVHFLYSVVSWGEKTRKCFTMTAFGVQTVSNLRICVHMTWISCEQDDERIILIHSGTSCSWGKLNDQTASSERNKFERSTWKFIFKRKRFPLNFVSSFDVMKACTTTLAQHKSSKTPSARANDLLEGATRKNLSRNPEKKSNFLNTIFLE